MGEQPKITMEQYEAACKQKERAEEIIFKYNSQQIGQFDDRWERFNHENEFFKPEDLIYSATARCRKCSAGLAHPKDCGMHHQWTCSNVLLGIGTDKGHDAFPFFMYEIKSEIQPSANGMTTRPK